MSGDDDCRVKVALRVRPLLPKEEIDEARVCAKVIDGQQILLGKDRAFTFDSLYGPNSNQDDVYEGCVRGLMNQFSRGIHCTILAYGQTGTGKTYTMGTGDLLRVSPDDHGIVPRAVALLFADLERKKKEAKDAGKTAEFSCKVSYMEIYNENLKDLLRPSTASKSLQIREDPNGGITVTGVHEEQVNSYDEMLAQLDRGTIARTTGATMMNSVSSRSHSILTITVNQDIHDPSNSLAPHETTSSKLHLVDLAGSERNKKTLASGQRFKESVSINSGLLALSNVISVLAEQKRDTDRKIHVPYRDSKLTRLLQDSLGGNASTLMIACISPADSNFEESLNTLKYANRAKNIRNKPVVNRDRHTVVVTQLRQELMQCKKLLSENGLNFESEIEALNAKQSTSTEVIQLADGSSMTLGQISALKRDKSSLEEEFQRLKTHHRNHSCWETLGVEVTEIVAEALQIISNIDDVESQQQLKSLFRSLEKRLSAKTNAQNRAGYSSAKTVKHPLSKQQTNLPQSSTRRKNPVSALTSNAKENSPPRVNRIVPSSMISTGKVPKMMTDLPENASPAVISSHVDQVIIENQKLLRNLKQLEDDLFKSECQAMQETEEKSKLQSAFTTAKEENKHLKQQNEKLAQQVGRLTQQHTQGESPRSSSSPVRVGEETVDTLQTEISRLQVEKDFLWEAKCRTEAEKKTLEKNVNHVQLIFQQEQQEMQLQLKALSVEIEHKASMVDDFMEREKRMNAVRQQNEKTIQQMEQEKARLTTELDRAFRKLENSDHVGEKLERMREDLRRQYEQRLKEQDNNLQGLRKKQRDAQQLLRHQGAETRKVHKLQNEVTQLRVHQTELKNSLRSKIDARETEHEERKKQLNQLHRQVRQLEVENIKYSTSLRMKEDSLNRMQQQLNCEKTKTKNLADKQADSRKEIERKQNWLDKEIELQKKKREAQNRLHRELNWRERILREKVDHQTARDELKKAKDAQDIKRLEKGLQGWEHKLQTLNRELETTQSDESPESATRLATLKEQHNLAQDSLNELTKAHTEACNTENQLRQVDDRIDVLQAALEYGQDIIEQIETEIEDLTKEGELLKDQSSSNVISPAREPPRQTHVTRDIKQPTSDQYQQTLQQYARKVAHLNKIDQEKDKEISVLKTSTTEHQETVEKLKNALKLAEMGFNRRLLKVQLEHKKILNKLMVSNGDANSPSEQFFTEDAA